MNSFHTRSYWKNTALNLCLTVCSVLVALALVELFLYYRDLPKLPTSGWRAYSPQSNNLGYRGQRISYTPEDFVAVLLGDSQVESAASRFDEMPERQLEGLLTALRGSQPVRVFSLGAGGYGQDQELLALREYFRSYRADLVILWETRANDIWNNTFRTHWPAVGTPKPTFWLADQKLRGPTEALGGQINSSWCRTMEVIKQVLKPPGLLEQNWQATLPAPYQPIENYSGSFSLRWQRLFDANRNYLRGDDLAAEKTHLSVWLTPPSPRMLYGRELTRRLINQIQRETEAQGGGFITFEAVRKSPFVDPRFYMYRLNGRYYRGSGKQADKNMAYINQDQRYYPIRIKVANWEVRRGGDHLTTAANEQVLRDLVKALASEGNVAAISVSESRAGGGAG